jgi:hypothetical protein
MTHDPKQTNGAGGDPSTSTSSAVNFGVERVRWAAEGSGSHWKLELVELGSMTPPMSRTAASPVVQTASEQAARRAAAWGPLALTHLLWRDSRLALFLLAAAVTSVVLALGADPQAHRSASAQLQPDASPVASTAAACPHLTASGEEPMRAERSAPLDSSVEIQAAECEKEDEDGHSKGLSTNAASTEGSQFFGARADRFRGAAQAFALSVSDLRELPRGPPAHLIS